MDQSIVKAIHQLAESRNQSFVLATRQKKGNKESSIVHSKASGSINRIQKIDRQAIVEYTIHYEWLHKQNEQFYVEERQETRRVQFSHGHLESDAEIILNQSDQEPIPSDLERIQVEVEDTTYRNKYNRREAVRYAERWWNDTNKSYHSFTDNCTNFISQCLHAGGAPMRRTGQKGKGWWYNGAEWSYSWTVAHSFRWYLSGATTGLRGEEKATAQELKLGDIICYDFTGDGRWQHTTIVVAKDENNEPLVNAQTVNSRMRFWTYEDSTAWTPEIKYKFFRVVVT
ncbi:amidase domain-containing protein [Alkalicoccobacillus porphyridii]|uniref:Amidase domain-containing protein n=1 Tax=Alkalicoccobacillus porphyridii TaxID=2597270 RepID=A0A553ZTL4_9BACI|nr:amidase domain-containing protein [Alkalicoccobacillus porphyridii]TSB44802.1 amidase domain-containing protein [Alkalicoccobacillus porphyridii]